MWIYLNRHFTKEELFKDAQYHYSSELQINAAMRYCYPHEWLNFKTDGIKCLEDTEQPKLSYTVVDDTITLGKGLTVSSKTKHARTLWPRNSSPRYVAKSYESITTKKLIQNIPGSSDCSTN